MPSYQQMQYCNPVLQSKHPLFLYKDILFLLMSESLKMLSAIGRYLNG